MPTEIRDHCARAENLDQHTESLSESVRANKDHNVSSDETASVPFTISNWDNDMLGGPLQMSRRRRPFAPTQPAELTNLRKINTCDQCLSKKIAVGSQQLH